MPIASATDREALAQSVGCVACHSSDGTDGVGPTWLGLVGSTSPTGAPVDEAYVRESILEPSASVADGFQGGVMPGNYASILSDQEIDALVAFILELG